ncbi:MAG: DUF2066 domain-containing protein [Thiohalocapsa sp.]
MHIGFAMSRPSAAENALARAAAAAYRIAGAAILALAVLAMPWHPGYAEETDPFSATVKVDATADTVVKARDMARLDGQRRALAAVAAQVGGASLPAEAAAKLAKLDDRTLTALVASFEVANERMSAVRYLAEYTFHFRPDQARRVLRNAGVTASVEAAAKPLVVLPVYQADGQLRLWEDPNPWRAVWEERGSSDGADNAAHLLVPLGDAADIATVDGDKARAGNAEALAAIAKRNGGGDAVVLVAALRGQPASPDGIDIAGRRYRAGRLVASHTEAITANPGENADALLQRAATLVAAGIDGGWKKEAAPAYDQLGTLTAVLPIAGLDDWIGARERLASLPLIRKITLVALSRQEATIEIGYGGSIDDLKAGLAGVSFDLVRGDPVWRLARRGSDAVP